MHTTNLSFKEVIKHFAIETLQNFSVLRTQMFLISSNTYFSEFNPIYINDKNARTALNLSIIYDILLQNIVKHSV